MDKSGSYRVYLAITTELVKEARRIHHTSNTATAALGRTLTGAGLMGLMLKSEQDKLSLIFKGDGPAQEILATAYANGNVKGYIANPSVELPLKEDGHLNVGGAIGRGNLTVIKDLGLKEPYVGRIDLVSGEIAEDLTQYMFTSEQQPGSVALGVRIGENGEVSAAGGFVVQLLPGAREEAINALEDALFFMDALTLLIQDAGNPEMLLNLIFKNMPEEYKPEILEERQISWHCGCSKEHMAGALVAIGKKDLAQIIEEDGKAELSCQFCRSTYKFTKEELEELLVHA